MDHPSIEQLRALDADEAARIEKLVEDGKIGRETAIGMANRAVRLHRA